MIEKIHQFGQISIYYDPNMELNQILIGRKESNYNFLIVGRKECDAYEKIARKLDKQYGRDMNLNDIGI